MTQSHSTNNSNKTLAPALSAGKQIGKFAACLLGTAGLCLTAYVITVDKLVPTTAVPATYKWFLLKEIPGPRIIFESGSNSHRGIDTEAVGNALGMTAINIADNAGYPLEDKITRLETFARAGDIVILPLEWTHYYREKLTDDYVETLFTENRDYYHSMPTAKRIKRALSLPPGKIISEISNRKSRAPLLTESPAMELHNAALTHPTGHSSREVSLGPGLGVAEQSCDDYILGKAPIREALKMGKNIKPALKRLKRLKARGVHIHFSWPVLVGQGCMMANTYVTGFRAEIEGAVNDAGFEFLGAPSQSLYGQALQDDTPYHLVQKGAAIHTSKIINFLKAQGYKRSASPFDITEFARHRLLELELADVKPLKQAAFPIGETIAVEDESSRKYVEFSAGWWDFERYGRWMRDNRAMFRITLPENISPNSALKIQGRTPTEQLEPVNVSVNGALVHSGLFGESAPLLVPVANLPQGEALSVFLTLPEAGTPISPQDRGQNEDTRSMTIHVQTLELTDRTVEPIAFPYAAPIAVPSPVPDNTPVPKIVPATLPEAEPTIAQPLISAAYQPCAYSVGPNMFNNAQISQLDNCAPLGNFNALKALNIHYGIGWWEQEAAGRWMKGNRAVLKLALPFDENRSTSGQYALRIAGDFFMGRQRPISAMIDGQLSRPFTAMNDGTSMISFETDKRGGSVDITLLIDGSKPLSPKDLGQSMDERTMTYFLKAAQLIPA